MNKLMCLVVVFLTLASCTRKPSGPLAFVTNERDGTITVIDTGTDRVTQRSKSWAAAGHSSESRSDASLGGYQLSN